MRFVMAVLLTLLLCGAAAGADRDAERIVARQVQSIVARDGAGGVAVALRLDGSIFRWRAGLLALCAFWPAVTARRATPAKRQS